MTMTASSLEALFTTRSSPSPFISSSRRIARISLVLLSLYTTLTSSSETTIIEPTIPSLHYNYDSAMSSSSSMAATTTTTTTDMEEMEAGLGTGTAAASVPIRTAFIASTSIHGEPQHPAATTDLLTTNHTDTSSPKIQALIDQTTTVFMAYLSPLLLTSNMEDTSRQAHDFSSLQMHQQSRELITRVAALYHQDNPYHNFVHASHMCQSMHQLLTSLNAQPKQHLPPHIQTIQQEPSLQLALFFAAIIHDVEHPGVPNRQWMQEQPALAQRYHNQSVAEQHALQVAWQLLQSDDLTQLRNAIFNQPHQKPSFQQVVEMAVLATDIADPQLVQVRQQQFDHYFSQEQSTEPISDDNDDAATSQLLDPKTVIALELFMQVSDISACMQPYAIFNEWNERLFAELTRAYQQGRAVWQPRHDYVQLELSFLDRYVMPLATKFRQCCGGGDVGFDYIAGSNNNKNSLLQHAQDIRHQWTLEGEQVVEKFMAQYQPSSSSSSDDSREQQEQQ